MYPEGTTLKSTRPTGSGDPEHRLSGHRDFGFALKEPERAKTYLDELYRRSAQIAQRVKLAREFCQIIRNRDVNAWLHWREEAKTSILAGFVKGLCLDEAAFMAALQQPWSNGQVEGQTRRLKLIKQSMYGRAKFDLLRLSVVTAA